MYRHFLVPVDHTEDSVDLVVRAVNLAAWMKARVTFLHTERRHHGAGTGSARFDPRGVAREVLAQAEAAARSWGVASRSIESGSGDAAAAIAAAARDQGCDLILVASHSPHGRTEAPPCEVPIDVLQHSDLPVLVTKTAALATSVPAVRVLRAEHRLLATVLHAWGQALESAEPAPVGWLQSALAFIERLEAEHHPKEKALFLRLRERTSTVDADLDEIGRQHEREGSMLDALAAQSQALTSSTDPAARKAAQRALAASVAEYTRFVWDHLGREEAVVLPAARRHLQAADWAQLEHAFLAVDPQATALECGRLLEAAGHHGDVPEPLAPGRAGCGRGD